MKMKNEYFSFYEFLDEFVDGSTKERWAYIVSKGTNHWKKLDPYDLWTRSTIGERNSYQFDNGIEDLLGECTSFSDATALVDAAFFGHDQGAYRKVSVASVLRRDTPILEGLLFVAPRRMVVCFTHEGDIRVFRKPNMPVRITN